MHHDQLNKSPLPRPRGLVRALTALSLAVPSLLIAKTSLAESVCPSGTNIYGQSAGGFCCDGTTGPGICHGTIVCALDPTRTQGYPICSTVCPPGSSVYGEWAGGFCCNGTVGSGGGSCSGDICALHPDMTQGFMLCQQENSPLCRDKGSRHLYGGMVGGFCCDGTVNPGNQTCTGTLCAVDAGHTYGNPLCTQNVPDCPGSMQRYGEWAGGFCCDGNVSADADTCDGDICALDPTRPQGLPMCDAYVAPETTQNGNRIFRTAIGAGTPLRFVVDQEDVTDGAGGVSISGSITVEVSGAASTTLANAVVQITFDEDGYVDTLTGMATVSLPGTGMLEDLECPPLAQVMVGLQWGDALKDPQGDYQIDAPIQEDRQYLFYKATSGLSAEYGPIELAAPVGSNTTIVVDPRDPSVYFGGSFSGIPGLESLGDVGLGLSAQGLLAFELEHTWGIEDADDTIDGNLYIKSGVPLPARLPLSLEGEIIVKLPDPDVAGDLTRIGVNGDLGLEISFAKDIVTFSLPLGGASAVGQFGPSPSPSDEVYFSGGVTTAGLTAALPSTFPIKLDAGILAAGRLGGVPANRFLRLHGHAMFGDYGVENADLYFTPTLTTASGHFLFPGFDANLTGTVTPTSASLHGQANVNIDIPVLQDVVGWGVVGTHWVETTWQCGTQWVADAFVSGYCHTAKGVCDTVPWMCDPPASCFEPKWCSEWHEEDVYGETTEQQWVDVTYQATANIHVTSPNSITVDVTNPVCPSELGGTCSFSAEDLTTSAPKLCVTVPVLGKHCTPLVAN